MGKIRYQRPTRKDSSTIIEYLLTIDQQHAILHAGCGAYMERLAIRQFTTELDKTFQTMVSNYLSEPIVYWDEFVAKFWEDNNNPNEKARETDKLNKASQLPRQRVSTFITHVKTTAAKAGISNTKQLGRIVLRGLLPKLILAAKTSVPNEGLKNGNGVEVGMRLIDRWVLRCRIAAVTGGALICIAVIVVVVIVAGVKS